ncbi:hypothetical protein Zmor_009825 [Zophobas morio]|uniref:CCHC-type domain-containing protein n=1 Tax=Zophobas morio TaxID=2755281 RepID=A0AA38MJ56_9CUCU|nr:hypothetical protein Zmor_009825 [Zophobas morio]
MAITADQLQQLIERLKPAETIKHFTHCPARFDGTRTKEAVEDFLATANFYKVTEKITDENALLGIPLLLQGTAYTWWTGVKAGINTWVDAVGVLRQEFAPTPPAYQIYLDVFATKQDQRTSTGLFVSQKRALLAQVEPADTESRQLDMVYGLLKWDIRSRVPRKMLHNFAQLLAAANEIEMQAQSRNIERGAVPTTAPAPPRNDKRARCEFCRHVGHETSACRKRQRHLSAKAPSQNNPVTCYGCGKPGVFRRNCPECNKENTNASTLNVQFCALDARKFERPAVQMNIDGMSGTAFLDSGARTSLASSQLYGLLKKKGHNFEDATVRLTQADVNSKISRIKTCTLPITLKGRTTATQFIAIPEALNSKTLLRADFLQKSRMVVDYGSQRWHYAGNRHECYGFISKEESPGPVEIAFHELRTPPPNANILKEKFIGNRPQEVASSMDTSETVEISDIISDLTGGYGPILTPLPATPVTARPRNPPHYHFGVETSRSAYMMSDAAFAVEREWSNALNPNDLQLLAEIRMATLDVHDVILRAEDEAVTLDTQQKMN